MLDRFFQLEERGTNSRREILAGTTTFLTMAYIIVVQPAVLSGEMFGTETGLDFGAVTTATCLAAALATAVMALYARTPIAQAPGMGENFFFVLSVIPAAAAAGFADPWQVALGVVFVAGVLFLLVTLVGLRQVIVDAISPSMKNAIAVGIGLFIALIGLQNATLVQIDQTLSMNTDFASPDLAVFFIGLLATAAFRAADSAASDPRQQKPGGGPFQVPIRTTRRRRLGRKPWSRPPSPPRRPARLLRRCPWAPRAATSGVSSSATDSIVTG